MEDCLVGAGRTVHVPRLDHIHRTGEQGGDEAGHTGPAEVAEHPVRQQVSGDQKVLKKKFKI